MWGKESTLLANLCMQAQRKHTCKYSDSPLARASASTMHAGMQAQQKRSNLELLRHAGVQTVDSSAHCLLQRRASSCAAGLTGTTNNRAAALPPRCAPHPLPPWSFRPSVKSPSRQSPQRMCPAPGPASDPCSRKPQMHPQCAME